MVDMDVIWQDYGLDRLEAGLETLFPESTLSFGDLLARVMEGDVLGALTGLFTGVAADFTSQLSGLRSVFVWLLVLGLVSSLMTHFAEIFNRRQVADMGFYFMYLLSGAVLLRCFFLAGETTLGIMERIVLFVRMMVPAYLLSVGIATGTVTAGASAQMMLLVICAVEEILTKGLVPLIYSMCMLAVVNGVWVEGKLNLIIELLEKGVGWALKGILGVVTGVSVLQTMVAPAVDSLRTSALQRIVSAIPGVGNAADGVVDTVLGCAVMLKNSIGVTVLILFVLMCAAPLLKIFLIAGLIKCAAAFMGIVSDRRITDCANGTGNAGLLLFRTAAASMLLLIISLAVVTAAVR